MIDNTRKHGSGIATDSADERRRSGISPRAGVTHTGESCGSVWRIVRWMDENKGSFLISRLILQTGIKLRTFQQDAPDDPRVLAKLWPALDSLLTPEEREALRQSLLRG